MVGLEAVPSSGASPFRQTANRLLLAVLFIESLVEPVAPYVRQEITGVEVVGQFVIVFPTGDPDRNVVHSNAI